MQAIRTKYHGPTNTKCSRFSAKCEAGQVYVNYNHSLNLDDNHKAACMALVKKLGWDEDGYGNVVGGEFDGCMYWVFVRK